LDGTTFTGNDVMMNRLQFESLGPDSESLHCYRPLLEQKREYDGSWINETVEEKPHL